MNYNNVDWVDAAQSPVINKPGSYYGDKKQSEDIQVGLYAYSQTQTTLKCSEIVAERSKAVASYLNWYNFVYSQSPDFKKGNGSGVVDPPSDKSSCAIGGIGWIVCPIINLLGSIVDQSWGVVEGYLKTDIQITRADNANPSYSAWKIMQGVANVAFVIAFLVIIFSQLTSFGVTNYGIKKLLPRLIIAAILVNISFYLCQIAVDLSNILGGSLKSLFDGLARGVYQPNFSGNADGIGVIAGVIGVGAGVAILYASLGTLIPVLLAGVVGLVMILFILIARQAIIVLLIIVSPLAFVAFLLPNTEKLFKTWQKTLTSMLLLFPIVALVVGDSRLASGILTTVFNTSAGISPTTAGLGGLAAAAVGILPLFIVPGLLKKALDGIGGIGAKLNAFGSKKILPIAVL